MPSQGSSYAAGAGGDDAGNATWSYAFVQVDIIDICVVVSIAVNIFITTSSSLACSRQALIPFNARDYCSCSFSFSLFMVIVIIIVYYSGYDYDY